jgi:hypothetical protein
MPVKANCGFALQKVAETWAMSQFHFAMVLVLNQILLESGLKTFTLLKVVYNTDSTLTRDYSWNMLIAKIPQFVLAKWECRIFFVKID